MHKSFGFVQFETKEEAENAVKEEKGKPLKGLKMGKLHNSYNALYIYCRI